MKQALILLRTLPPDSDPVVLPQKLEIPTKPKINKESQPNGDANQTNSDANGPAVSANGTSSKRKRSPEDSAYDQGQILKRKREEERDEAQQPNLKRGKVANPDDLVVLDDSHNGAIVIDD